MAKFIHFDTGFGSNIIYNADKIRHIHQLDNRIYIESKGKEDHYDYKNEQTAYEVYCYILTQLED